MNELNITLPIPDDEFIRGSVPITKSEVRTLTISKMRLSRKSNIIDIGAGTGSVSIECAITAPDGSTFSVERNIEAVQLINKNIEKFNLGNIKVIQGEAPAALSQINNFDRVFVGGTGGKVRDILEWIDQHITPGGIIALNSITLETLISSYNFFKDRDYTTDIIQVSISRCEKAGSSNMFRALNPVYITTAEKI